MGIVFDEIVSEVTVPDTRRSSSDQIQNSEQSGERTVSQADLQKLLRRAEIRKLRLMAD